MTITRLPLYPSSGARASLSPSQLASLNEKIAHCLQQTIALPPEKRNSSATQAFVSSYAKDAAQEFLQTLIWDAAPSSETKIETREAKTIRARVLLLSERLASSGSLELSTLLDLTIVYPTHPARLRALLSSAVRAAPTLPAELTATAIPAFTTILTNTTSTGLYSLRKTAHCILCLLRPAPPGIVRAFAMDKPFMLGIARAYDAGLAALVQSYGGLRLPPDGSDLGRPLDEWERIFLETKVALLDIFHLLLKVLLDGLTRSTGPALAADSEKTFDIIFALHELPDSSSSSSSSSASTPFLNRTLLADYQHSYDLSHLLESTLSKMASEDARLEFLTTALHSLDDEPQASSGPRPGALKLLLGSGVPPGIDNIGRGPRPPVSAPSEDKKVDQQVSDALAILPDYDPAYIRALLLHTEYGGSVEGVVGALLEGTAPAPEAVTQQQPVHASTEQEPFEFTRDRRNVFDDEAMDLSKLRVGKKRFVTNKPVDIHHSSRPYLVSGDAATVLRDRTFIEQMKADILRRAEAVSDSEEEDEPSGGTGKGKAMHVAFDEELEEIDAVRVVGDGEGTSEEDDDDDELVGTSGQATPAKANPEATIELAYIADAKVFERDAATRRSEERTALRSQTGWSDEQIEGWRIMLERNPKQKERMLAKHEFAGNKIVAGPLLVGPSRSEGEGSRGRGRGGGRGGRGGGRSRGGGGGGSEQQDRAWKDKHKASRANHNRKRGHDKKMSRVAGPPPS
ncbi:hypothetical protein BV25DRAFT_1987939 [Artomyces pyxidatus]|uniref:Uncharacterized protein n=1 Tax=Artomyces pyxidatus TaxID=48021 RepID=A0ACB8TEI2_9AGAM|nr:hypothetical protein BV25DRAFT_1987939 [Artomyces pyxidatus]